jgi:hypothetical protein
MNRVFAWPVGQDQGFSSPIAHAILYSVAATAGGAILGTAVAIATVALRAVPGGILVPAAAILAFMGACLQVTGRMGWFPQRRAQVPGSWLLLSPIRYALAFGGILGFAALTFLHHAVWYSWFAAIVAQRDPQLGVLAGALFGVTRGLVPVVVRVFLRSPSKAEAGHRFLAGQRFGLLARWALVAAGVLLTVGIAGQG